MIRKFIRNAAVKGWSKELDQFLAMYEDQTRTQQADYFIYSVRTRAGLQLEGILGFPEGSRNNEPELMAYPIMSSQFEKVIDHFNQNGPTTEAACLSIWLHTLRSFLYPELKPSVGRLWSIILSTKDLWPEMLQYHYKLDVADGSINKEKLRDTYGLATTILKTLPPHEHEQ